MAEPNLPYDAASLAAAIDSPSAQNVASHVASLIRVGSLRPGDRLPHVRDLSRVLQVSPGTISAAWALLRKRGLLVGMGKSGIRVSSPASLAAALGGFARLGNQLDLRFLFPDPALLPPLSEALAHAAALPRLEEYYERPILPELQTAVARDWPSDAERFVVTNGSSDALWSTLHALSVAGDRVLVESPTQPQMLSVIADLGLDSVPVTLDDEGPRPDELRRALARRPVAFFYQPRSQVPTGCTVTARRSAELAEVLKRHPQVAVVEYDDLGSADPSDLASVSTVLPRQTLFVRSFEKSHSPDLRIAVVGGPSITVESIHAQIRLTRQWSSRILQAALAWLIEDDATADRLAHARATYAERRQSLVKALEARGVPPDGAGGFCLWVRVVDEQRALELLAKHGVLAFAGRSSYADDPQPHIRVATSRLAADYDELADLVASAAQQVG